MITKEFIDKNCIYPDFPIKGIKFVDIFPLIESSSLISQLSPIRDSLEGIVLLPEARGFLFYEALRQPNTFILPLRKKSKLPGSLLQIDITKEYGSDSLFLQLDALQRAVSHLLPRYPHGIPVTIFDDILATGGTALGIFNKINNLDPSSLSSSIPSCQLQVKSACFYLEIDSLHGRQALPNILVNSVYHI